METNDILASLEPFNLLPSARTMGAASWKRLRKPANPQDTSTSARTMGAASWKRSDRGRTVRFGQVTAFRAHGGRGLMETLGVIPMGGS